MSSFEAGERQDGLAPGVPADYYRSIHEAELKHWWHRGMLQISAVLLGERLSYADLRLLDAGCGTGGFLSWALKSMSVARACGSDISPVAIDFARTRVPEAELAVAPLSALPFGDASFDLVFVNDVLQHVPESEVDRSISELARVLVPGGVLLVRTNGARRMRRERDDWRVYDRAGLSAALAGGGLHCERLTYANSVLSAWAAVSGREPHAPNESGHGIPSAREGRAHGAVGRALLAAEAWFLRRTRRSLPYGHTLFAVARRWT